jgi:CheY-like chemotaxis protein
METMAKTNARILIKTLAGIPLFSGLEAAQIQTLLGASQPKRFEIGSRVCASGSPSEEMFVLLSGLLGVVGTDGSTVATLTPVTTMGEVGMVTGQTFTSTVEAIDSSNVLVFEKAAFEDVLASDSGMAACVYRNIVNLLAGKIIKDNVRVRDYLREKVEQEQRIKQYRHRAELASDWLVSKAGFDPEKLARSLDEHMQDTISLRVLVVDDEPAIRRMICEALADFDTIEARDGEEALEEIDSEPPDLIITDIRMPGLNGYALLEQVRGKYPDMPVLGISGYASDEDVHAHHFDGFMEKPMNLKDFRHLVESTVGID